MSPSRVYPDGQVVVFFGFFTLSRVLAPIENEQALAEQPVDVAVDVRTLDAAVQEEGLVRAREAERRARPARRARP